MTLRTRIAFFGVLAVACGGGSTVATFSPTPEELCAALVACDSSLSMAACLSNAQPEFDEASRRGCVEEANAANACTRAGLTGDGGSCDTLMLPAACTAPYGAYRACVIAAGGGGGPRACLVESSSLRSCTTYAEGLDASMLCAAQMGASMETCPTADRIGRCTLGTPPSAATIDYYMPSPLTADALMGICTMNAGTWSMP